MYRGYPKWVIFSEFPSSSYPLYPASIRSELLNSYEWLKRSFTLHYHLKHTWYFTNSKELDSEKSAILFDPQKASRMRVLVSVRKQSCELHVPKQKEVSSPLVPPPERNSSKNVRVRNAWFIVTWWPFVARLEIAGGYNSFILNWRRRAVSADDRPYSRTCQCESSRIF